MCKRLWELAKDVAQIAETIMDIAGATAAAAFAKAVSFFTFLLPKFGEWLTASTDEGAGSSR